MGVNDQLPPPSATTVPSSVVPLNRLTVLLASAVPASVGVASLVVPPPVTRPATGATLSVTLTISGAAGGAASTTTLALSLVLPAASVALTTTVVPLASGVTGV